MKKVVVLTVFCILLSVVSVYALPPSGLQMIQVSIDRAENIGDRILGAINLISGVVVVSVLMFIGIKIMLAAPAEKAQIKGMMVPYLVGAVIVFSTSTLVTIISRIAGRITP